MRTVFPKFDLGKTTRDFSKPISTVYATIDRDGEQVARTRAAENGIRKVPLAGNPRDDFVRRWLDWK